MRSDVHMHTRFSNDSDSDPEKMIEESIRRGLTMICFTDHYDKDNFDWGEEAIFDEVKYFDFMPKIREKYDGQIDIRIGAEIGLQPHLSEFYEKFVSKHPLDFVIGSMHSAMGHDLATKIIYQSYSDEEAYRICFEEMLEDVRVIKSFDVLGHMDYMIRYSKNKAESYDPMKYMEIIDEIFKILISEGRGIEMNMSGIKYGLGFPHPHTTILKRYRELGGEVITVGADGHIPQHIAYDYHLADDILKDCGFRFYTEFKKRKPEFIRL